MNLDMDSLVELCPANTGAIRFYVRSISGFAQLILTGIDRPHKDIFQITLSHQQTSIIESKSPIMQHAVTNFIDLRTQYQEFWVTWHGESVRVGLGDNAVPFIELRFLMEQKDVIGYVKFVRTCASGHLIEWIYERPPVISKALKPKKLSSGELRWVTLVDHQLPPDALIGGFEKEPLYIACALHNNSMCPGKYVPSQRRAYVPWGGREHAKDDFQILCGYNAVWVKTEGDKIPQNAFIGGRSELRSEPLYVGRAVHDGNLVNGKIHVVYHACYLPYQGKEVEVYSSFEILVCPDKNYRGILDGCEADL